MAESTPVAASPGVMASIGATVSNLAKQFPEMGADALTAMVAQKTAEAEADKAKADAKTAKALAAAEASKTEQLTLAQKAKAQAPWLIPVAVGGAALALWYFLKKRK